MAIGYTQLGNVTNDGLTAVVNSIATVNGRLYAVCGIGASDSNGGANLYDTLTVTTTGPTPTQLGINRGWTSEKSCLGSIDTFIGDGATINVTVTMGTPTGSPLSPITGCCVIELSETVSTDRTNTFEGDVGAGPDWVHDIVIAGTPVANNRTLSLIVEVCYPSIGSFAPRYSETEIQEGSDTHAGGSGFSSGVGTNVAWQVQISPANSLTNGRTGAVDDYKIVEIAVELVSSAAPPPEVTFVAAGSFAGNITVATQAITAPACAAGDILICAIINKSVTANAVTPPDGTWTAVIATEVNDCTTAADDHQYSLYWHRATASDSGAAFTFTKATDDNLLFGGVIVAYRGCVVAGSPLDATVAVRTETAGAADNVTFPAYDPVSTNNRVVYVAYYGNDLTTFAAAMSADTNPDCTKDCDVESALGNDCSIAITSGTNDGSSIAGRTWASASTTDAGNTGVVFALVAQIPPVGGQIIVRQAVQHGAVR